MGGFLTFKSLYSIRLLFYTTFFFVLFKCASSLSVGIHFIYLILQLLIHLAMWKLRWFFVLCYRNCNILADVASSPMISTEVPKDIYPL